MPWESMTCSWSQSIFSFLFTSTKLGLYSYRLGACKFTKVYSCAVLSSAMVSEMTKASSRVFYLRSKIVMFTLLGAGISALPLLANAAEEVGQTVRVKNSVNGSIGNRQLQPKDPVFESEDIFAQTNSHGELRLSDNSKVLVGENSSVKLDDFIVGSKGFDSGTFKVAKGAFRLITGNSRKNSMSVQTPLATIGARGTVFDVYVGAGGVTRVILFSGVVEVCSSERCIVAEDRCDIVEVTDSEIRQLDYLRSGDVAEEDRDYSLINRQTRFNTSWRAPVSACTTKAAFDPQVQKKRRANRSATPPGTPLRNRVPNQSAPEQNDYNGNNEYSGEYDGDY